MTMHAMDAMCEDWCQWVWPSWRWPIYMREDNDSNVLVMITLLIWTTWTLVSKRLLQTHLSCITCNAMSQLLSSWYVVSPRTMSAHKISCRGCSLMSWRIRYSASASQMAWPCRTWWWLAKEIHKLNPRGGHGHGHPKTKEAGVESKGLHVNMKKTICRRHLAWWRDPYGLPRTRPNWKPPFQWKITWSGKFRSVIKLHPPYTRN